ncbi:MAG: hypothetical protein EXS00_04755 [Phycisphaerales bacterium]|nr:hypothetical protein [Phycisphaerales bacterium]
MVTHLTIVESARRFLSAGAIGTAAIACTLFVTAPSSAQLGAAAGFKEAFTPEYMNRDMDLFVEFLELEPWQQPIVQALLSDYQDDFKAGVDGMRDRMESIRDKITGSDQNAIAIVMQPINQWSLERKALGLRFIENLRSQLSEEQLRDNWTRLERAIRRDKELPRGVIGGESVDIVVITRELDVPPPVMDSAKEALERYEINLDAALAARAQQMDESQPLIKQAMIDNDLTVGLRELEKIVAHRVGVRCAQDIGITEVTAAMGAPWGETVRIESLRRSFPIAYRTTSLESFFAEALGLEGITPEQIAKIEALHLDYQSQFDSYTDRIVESQRVEEPKQQTQSVRQSVARQSGQPAIKPLENPYKDLLDEREALSGKYRGLIADVLGEVLTAKLTGAAKFDSLEAARMAAEAGRAAASAERDGKASSTGSPVGGLSGAGRGGRGSGSASPGSAAGAAGTPASITED